MFNNINSCCFNTVINHNEYRLWIITLHFATYNKCSHGISRITNLFSRGWIIPENTVKYIRFSLKSRWLEIPVQQFSKDDNWQLPAFSRIFLCRIKPSMIHACSYNGQLRLSQIFTFKSDFAVNGAFPKLSNYYFQSYYQSNKTCGNWTKLFTWTCYFS